MSTPLVLIPGMMCDQRLFAPQIEAFQDVEIIIANITAHDSMQQLATDILQKMPEKFSLGGLSMGGIVAMEIWRQAPQRVQGLCLMDTNPLAETEELKARRKAQIAKVKAGKLNQVMRDEMKPNYLFDGQNKKDILALCMDMALCLGDEAFINQSIALQNRRDQCETLKKVTCRTLILHGEDDKLCPAHRHQLMHKLMPHAHYTIIEQAGHLPTLENPQQINIELKKWLTSMQ